MGSVLRTHNARTRHPDLEKANLDDDDDSPIAGQQCLSVKKLKRKMKRKKKRNSREQQHGSPPPDQKKITTTVEYLTLRQCILLSPAREPECSNGGEPFVFSPLFKRVCPPSSDVDEASASMMASLCQARDSFSFDRPLKISGEDDREEKQEEGAVSSASICRTESGRLTKKVRFRSPEEADVIIFYSPRDEY